MIGGVIAMFTRPHPESHHLDHDPVLRVVDNRHGPEDTSALSTRDQADPSYTGLLLRSR
jgi:hypothetical protein